MWVSYVAPLCDSPTFGHGLVTWLETVLVGFKGFWSRCRISWIPASGTGQICPTALGLFGDFENVIHPKVYCSRFTKAFLGEVISRIVSQRRKLVRSEVNSF